MWPESPTNRAKLWIVALAGFIALMATLDPLRGQEGATRPVPAPWRPSFNSVNGNGAAAIGAAANGEGQSAPRPGPEPEAAASETAPPRQDPFRSESAIGIPGNLQDRASTGQNAPPPATLNRTTELGDQSTQTGWPTPAAGEAPQDVEITRVSRTFSSLPSDAGQIWREYDILPYTSQITNTPNPQQAVVDWVLRQTGTEMWFNEPFGILSASRDKLIVYHTPEIHNEVRRMLDRFVHSQGQVQLLDITLVTIGSPNWREMNYGALQPIEVQSPGVEAWMVSKENAAMLMNQLSSRSDFFNHGGGRVAHHDGQDVYLEKRKPLQFIRNLRWTPGQGAGYQPLMTQISEGYNLRISSLTAVDGKTAEVFIKCEVDQVEKLSNVRVFVPTAAGGTDRVNLQIPQVISYRLQERFRWPTDQVLVLSCGVVANPSSEGPKSIASLLDPKSGRGDALLFIEYRGPQPVRAAQFNAVGEGAPLGQVNPK